MSGEQILRCAVIKKLEGLSYDRLTFALEDSLTLRDFCRFSFQKAPKRSTLAENISSIGPGVWKQIADALTQWAARTGLEKGRKVRIDATPVSCSIRQPTDNQLLYDAVRVLTRLLAALSAKVDFAWTDHTRRAKKRHMKILNSRRPALRLAPLPGSAMGGRPDALVRGRGLRSRRGGCGGGSDHVQTGEKTAPLRRLDGPGDRPDPAA